MIVKTKLYLISAYMTFFVKSLIGFKKKNHSCK